MDPLLDRYSDLEKPPHWPQRDSESAELRRRSWRKSLYDFVTIPQDHPSRQAPEWPDKKGDKPGRSWEINKMESVLGKRSITDELNFVRQTAENAVIL